MYIPRPARSSSCRAAVGVHCIPAKLDRDGIVQRDRDAHGRPRPRRSQPRHSPRWATKCREWSGVEAQGAKKAGCRAGTSCHPGVGGKEPAAGSARAVRGSGDCPRWHWCGASPPAGCGTDVPLGAGRGAVRGVGSMQPTLRGAQGPSDQSAAAGGSSAKGACAGRHGRPRGGARAGNPMWVGMRVATRSSSMRAMRRMGPAHLGHTSTSRR